MVERKRKLKVFVSCKNGKAIVFPAYRRKDLLTIGDIQLEVAVKEITTDDEYEAYLNLANFHYRSKKLFGRTAILVIVPQSGLLPKALGYIELSTSFFMNKARQKVFEKGFADAGGAVRWDTWNVNTARKFINVVVRIARCVVHPEFRGLGIGEILVSHACAFTKDRWQIAGLKPYFLEITADMLKFVPFVQKAGLKYIGTTEGNLNRVKRDMEYVVQNIDRVNNNEILRRKSGAIIQLQVKYARKVLDILKDSNKNFEEFNKQLISLESITPDEYALLHGIIRFPKPTYMAGLTRRAKAFLNKTMQELNIVDTFKTVPYKVQAISRPIYVKDLTVRFSSSVARTLKTSEVQEAFGIAPEHLDTVVFKNLTLEISPGTIILVTGASGSGKTTFIKLLTGQLDSSEGIQIEGVVDMPPDVSIGTFTPIRSSEPLVEALGGDDVLKALYALNMSGLTEAQLYLRRYRELSNGQQYRAMIANLIDSGANVWAADEFCSALDFFTANIVAQNVRKHVKHIGITVIVASPYPQPFLNSLQPDIVVSMFSAWEHRIYSGSKFAQMLQDNQLPKLADDVQARPLATNFTEMGI